MKRQVPYSTPEGYFDDLRNRLAEIPQTIHQSAYPSSMGRVVTAIAIAASLAVGVFAGLSISSRSNADRLAQEEVIEYLIESGTTLAQIENCLYSAL